jgi:16S rRNA (cytidine1402-2'-O)-methyltransferase
MAGAILLVGTPIGNLGDLSARAVDALRTADVIAAEDTRRTRALLTHAGIPAAGRLRALHAHNERTDAVELVEAAAGGARVAVVSDAGMPSVSDPGAAVVAAAVEAGVAVEVVPGPSAVLTALVLSGLPADRFVFEGFLPRKGRERTARIAAVVGEPRTVVLFEAPHRVRATLAELVAAAGPDRPVVVTRELTKLHEEVWRGPLGGAVAHVEASAPRGEYTIVLAGREGAGEAASDADLEAALRAELAAGASARDAAANVAAGFSVPRRRAYELATRLNRE